MTCSEAETSAYEGKPQHTAGLCDSSDCMDSPEAYI